LIHQLIIAKEGDESIFSFFIGKDHPSWSPSAVIQNFNPSNQSKPTCQKKFYFGGPLTDQPSQKLTLFDGQKAVCLDEKIAPQVNNCLVYSFGIQNKWSFEESMEEHLGCHVRFFNQLSLISDQFLYQSLIHPLSGLLF